MLRNVPSTTTPGFALLLTLVVVSVVLAIGLTLVEISLKQIALSGTARDSEIAFHAAYAGVECAQFWRAALEGDFLDVDENGSADPDLPYCVDGPVSSLSHSGPIPEDGGTVWHTVYQMTWGADNNRCTEFDMYIFDAREGAISDYNITNLGDRSCPDELVCTAILSRGYNRACTDIGSLRTVQREVVLTY